MERLGGSEIACRHGRGPDARHRREKLALGGSRVGRVVMALSCVGLRGGWARRGSGLGRRRGHRVVVVVTIRLRRLEPLRQQLANVVRQGQQRAQSGVQLRSSCRSTVSPSLHLDRSRRDRDRSLAAEHA
jgi:hypothetical protein